MKNKKIIIVGHGHVNRGESFAQSLTVAGTIADFTIMKIKEAQQQVLILKDEKQITPFNDSYYDNLTPRKNRLAKSQIKKNPIKAKYLGKKNHFKK